MAPLLTVSLPTYNCVETKRAVDSILAQTFTDFVLVVVNDGGETPDLPEDPRLVMLQLDANRGRYYCDAVTLEACNTEWFTVHDADDWSEPHRFEHMLALATGREAVVGGLLNYDLRNSFRHPAPPLRKGDPNRIQHLWHISALYRTETLRGLIAPSFRVGYDTLLANFLSIAADVAFDDALLYHRVRRMGSLTTDPKTNIRSPLRQREASQLLQMWKQISRRNPTLEHLRALVRQRVPEKIWQQVEADAARLRLLLPAG